ncbi:hypothetical protein ACFL6Z_09910, partial [Pseudomonadota bacterium]
DQSPSKIMRFSAFFVRGGRVSQEGIAVDTLLVGCGWTTHDVNPNGVWNNTDQTILNPKKSQSLKFRMRCRMHFSIEIQSCL